MYIAITYIGTRSGFQARIGRTCYDFEWRKSLPIGNKQDEVNFKHAMTFSKWRDRSGKKIFVLE